MNKNNHKTTNTNTTTNNNELANPNLNLTLTVNTHGKSDNPKTKKQTNRQIKRPSKHTLEWVVWLILVNVKCGGSDSAFL